MTVSWMPLKNLEKEVMPTRILLDTNIIIHREASRVLNQDIGTLFYWMDRLQMQKCIHPRSVEEISTHQNEEIVNTMRAKIKNYILLKTISPESDAIIAIRANDNSVNDEIDTDLVKEVFNERVDILISEDRGIHRKASALNISEKVYKIDAFLEKVIAENPELKDYEVLAARKEYFGNIDLSDSFFNSFKSDYSEFESWFNRKADEICYVCRTDGQVKAFLFLKTEGTSENYDNVSPSFAPKRRLKIGTFKVVSTGLKLGERFLKIIFDNAFQFNVDEIYVTIFDKREEQERLINLLKDWGFTIWGTKSTSNGNEVVMTRSLAPAANRLNPKLTYPFVSKRSNQYIVPIYPEYHTELFPDSILNNESPEEFTENEPYRNAIQKVYISRSINRNLNPGDVIIFYRTGGRHRSVISTIGVVENVVHNIRNEEHFIQLCRKRSVFDDNGLRRYWNYSPGNRPFIVNFLYVDSFPTPKVNYNTLEQAGLINEPPRGFEPLELTKFERMLQLARANENYIVD